MSFSENYNKAIGSKGKNSANSYKEELTKSFKTAPRVAQQQAPAPTNQPYKPTFQIDVDTPSQFNVPTNTANSTPAFKGQNITPPKAQAPAFTPEGYNYTPYNYTPLPESQKPQVNRNIEAGREFVRDVTTGVKAMVNWLPNKLKETKFYQNNEEEIKGSIQKAKDIKKKVEPFTFTGKAQNIIPAKEVGSSLIRGASSAFSMISDPLNFVSRVITKKSNPVLDVYKGMFDEISNTFETEKSKKIKSTSFSWEKAKDPAFYYTQGAELVPVTLAYYYTGKTIIGGVGVLTKTLKLGKLTQTILGSGATGVVVRGIESSSEAEEGYYRAKEMGKSEEEALKVGREVFINDMKLAGVDAVQIALLFSPYKLPSNAPVIKKILSTIAIGATEAITEGGEEAYQYNVTENALTPEQKMSTWKRLLTDPNARESAFLGGLMGVVFTAGGRIDQSKQLKLQEAYLDEIAGKLSPEVQTEYNKLKSVEEKTTFMEDYIETDYQAVSEAIIQITEEHTNNVNIAKESLDLVDQTIDTQGKTALEIQKEIEKQIYEIENDNTPDTPAQQELVDRHSTLMQRLGELNPDTEGEEIANINREISEINQKLSETQQDFTPEATQEESEIQEEDNSSFSLDPRNYNSAEEFVKALGEKYTPNLEFDANLDEREVSKEEIDFYENKLRFLDPDQNFLLEGEKRDVAKVVKEFTDIWNKAQGKKEVSRETKEKKKTQKEIVKETIAKKEKATIKEIAKETGILEPNVRRILGVGAKEGVFERVADGVYKITNKQGEEVAVIIPADAVETLPKLAKEGFKADMVFLDIPYDTPAVKGGNRGVDYKLLSVGDFGIILDAVKEIAKTEDTPIIHMYSQAPSGLKAMQKYNDLFTNKGFIAIGKGEYQKTFKDGSPVTSPNGKVAQPEGIIVFNRSGNVEKELNLNFKMVRPKGYQTEKPAEMLKAMIEMTTNEGDVVLDPFAGSGVTGAEAVKAGRKTVLIEKDKDVAKNITKPRVEEAVKETKEKAPVQTLTEAEIKIPEKTRYYIFDENGFTPVKGKPVFIDEAYSATFIYKLLGEYRVTELESGQFIGLGKTEAEAITNAKSKTSEAKEFAGFNDVLAKAIQKAKDQGYPSPTYIADKIKLFQDYLAKEQSKAPEEGRDDGMYLEVSDSKEKPKNKPALKKSDALKLAQIAGDKMTLIYNAEKDRLIWTSKDGKQVIELIPKALGVKELELKDGESIIISKEALKKAGDIFMLSEYEKNQKKRSLYEKASQEKAGIISQTEARERFRKYFDEKEVPVQFTERILTPEGAEAFARYYDGMVQFSQNPNQYTPDHEAVHAFLDLFISPQRKNGILSEAYTDMAKLFGEVKMNKKLQEIVDLYRGEELSRTEAKRILAEEYLAEGFVKYVKARASGRQTKGLFSRLYERVMKFLQKLAGKIQTNRGETLSPHSAKALFEDIINKNRESRADYQKRLRVFFEAKNKELEQSTKALEIILNEFKKEVVDASGIKGVVNRSGISGKDKTLILNTLEKFDQKVSIAEFASAVKSQLLPVEVVTSDIYADEGMIRILRNEDRQTAKTIILNTPFQHGIIGHFPSAFDKKTKKADIEVRKVEAGELKGVAYDIWLVLKKGATDITDVFGKFYSEKTAQEYLDNFDKRIIVEAGMLSAYRKFNEGKTEFIMEVQSDVFQKDTDKLLRSNEQLLENELKGFDEEIASLTRDIDGLERARTTLPYDPDYLIERKKEEIAVIEKSKERARKEYSEREGMYFVRKYENPLSNINRMLDILKKTEVEGFDGDIHPISDNARIIASNLRLLGNDFVSEVQGVMGIQDKTNALRYEKLTPEGKLEALKEQKNKLVSLTTDAVNKITKLKDSLPEAQVQEIENSKKFMELKNSWYEPTIRTAIRKAYKDGSETFRLATDYTVSFVEEYIEQEYEPDMGDEIQDFSDNTKAEIEALGVGGIYNGGIFENAVITEIDFDGFQIAYAQDKSVLTVLSADEVLKKALEEVDLNEESPEDVEARFSGSEFDVNGYIKGITNGEYSDFIKGSQDYYIFSETEAELGYEKLGYKTAFEGDATTFSLEDIPNEEHRSIAKKYSEKGEFVKFLKKIRPDLRLVTDENGFTWWETTLTPEDGRPIAMFERKEDVGSVPVLTDENGNYVGTYRKVKAIQFPELLKFAKELGTNEVFLKKYPKARGMFYGGVNKIGLHPDIFADQRIREQVLAHEIGHFVDYLPDGIMGGNLIGKLAVIKGFKKHFLAEAGQTRSNPEIREQLLKLDRIWSPFDETKTTKGYLDYRNSADELYAQFISALFVDPALVEEVAPTAYNVFFKRLDEKREVLQAYVDVQNQLRNTRDVLETRQKDVQKMFVNAEITALNREKLRRENEKAKELSFWFKLKSDIIDTSEAVRSRVKKVEKRTGRKYDDTANPVFDLEEDKYIAGKVKAEIDTKFNHIHKELLEKGLTWEELGEVMFYERILFGDRGQVANPLGLSPEYLTEIYGKEIAEMYDDLGNVVEQGEYKIGILAEKIGEENFAFLKQKAVEFRKGLKDIFIDGYNAGLYSEGLYELIQTNEFYIPFRPVKYSDNKLSFKVQRKEGTLNDIENPANTAIEKAISIIVSIQKNKTKQKVVDFFKTEFADEITESDYKFDNNARTPIKPKDEKTGLITVMENGKVRGYYLEKYIVDSINASTIDQNNIAIASLRFSNSKWFRPAFITFNLGFQLMNFKRDMIRAIKVNPDKSLIISTYKMLRGYGKGLKPALARGFDFENATIQEMEENKILSITYNDLSQGETTEDKQIDRLLVRSGVMEKKPSKFSQNIFVKPIYAVMDFVEKMGNVIETLPKVAGYYEMKGKMPPNEFRSFIRRKVGSPDFLAGGKIKPLTNNVFLFSNSILQGWRADIEVATDPRTRAGWWWKTAQVNLVPKLLMFLGAMGVFGNDDDDEVKQIINMATEYDKTNYNIVPLGIDQNGKAIYFRLAQDETGRYVSAVFWKGLNMLTNDERRNLYKEFLDIGGYTAGQLPSVTPVFSTVWNVGIFLSGNNPYDSYRNRLVLTDQEMEAGGTIALKKYLAWQWEQIGGSVFMKLYNPSTPQEQTPLEKSFKFPVVGQVINRFIRVTDYGLTEQRNKTIDKLRQEKARKTINEKDLVFEYAQRLQGIQDQGIITQVEQELVEKTIGHPAPYSKEEQTLARTTAKRLKTMLQKTNNPADVDMLITARSNAEKLELLQIHKEEMEAQEYQEFILFLGKEKIISEEVYEKAQRL